MKNDFFARIRSTMMANLQVSMGSIFESMHMGPKQLSEILGLPESKIKNLKKNVDSITELEYVALCGLIDNEMRKDKNVEQKIKNIMNIQDEEPVSLLDRWMMVFDEEEEEEEEEKIVDGQEIDAAAMTLLAENYKVFLNYDSLKLCRDNEKFFELLKEMKKNNNTFIVPLRAVDKLQNDMLSFRDIKEVKRAMSLLNRLKESNDIVLKGDETDGTVEEVILKVFGAFKSRYQMALLTEDETLAKQLQGMNHQSGGNSICVISLKNNGMKVYNALTEEEIAALTPVASVKEVEDEVQVEQEDEIKKVEEIAKIDEDEDEIDEGEIDEIDEIDEDEIDGDEIDEIDEIDEDDSFRVVEDEEELEFIPGDDLELGEADELPPADDLNSWIKKGMTTSNDQEDLFKTVVVEKKINTDSNAEDLPDLSELDLDILDIDDDDEDDGYENKNGWDYV